MPRRRSGATLLPWLSARQDGKEGRFLQIGNTLLLDKRFQALSSGARYLFLCLAMEAGGKRSVSFSRGVTAKKYGIPKNSFTRHCSELEKSGFIRRIESGDFLQFAPAVYEFSLEWKTKPAPQNGAS